MKVEPKIPVPPNVVKVSTLKQGSCFISDGRLHMLIDEDPLAVDLSTGDEYDYEDNYLVVPVAAQVTWSEKKSKAGKKKITKTNEQ